MTARRLSRRKAVDRLATGVVTAAGFASIAALLGIFALLLVRSVQAWGGGIETAPLTAEERAALGPETVAALESTHRGPPELRDVVATPNWKPDAEPPAYGLIALVAGTFLTTFGALALAVPLGVATAAWLAFGARGRIRDVVKLGVELLAAVPSVVVGYLGLELVGPAIAAVFGAPGGLTALNGAILLAVMALPTVVSLSEDALSSVPNATVEAALALGADRWQMLTGVVMPAARSGLFAAIMLGMGRAIGETMTVLMATGNVTALPSTLLDPVRTLTATIAIELGEVPRSTTHYYMLFFVGLVLFTITLAINFVADAVQRRGERALKS